MIEKHIFEKLEDKILGLSKRLEVVLKTTSDAKQRKRVSIELARLKKDYMRLQGNSFTEDDVVRYLGEIPEESAESEGDEEEVTFETRFNKYPLLREVPIVEAAEFCNERETNELYSFLSFIENEYLGALSETHLSLDYAFSQKRDVFFSDFSVLQMLFRNYLNVLEDLSGNATFNEYEEKLRTMRSKEHMNFLMKTGDYIKKLSAFIGTLLQDYRDGGNIIMEPESELHFDELHGKRLLEGVNVVVALEKFEQFLIELIYYLNIPELK